MNADIKEALLDRFRTYLDGLDDGDSGNEPAVMDQSSEASDLFSVFVELAATRNEVRAQARLTKDAFDQFRGVFDTLQASHAAMEQELKDARSRAREQNRAALRPLLLDVIDVRDRLVAGLNSAAPPLAAGWFSRWRRQTPTAEDPWREGLAMTLRRLDQVLADRRVTPVELVGRPFTPSLARAVATIEDPTIADGIVAGEARAGFLWEDELLRAAEVTVVRNRTAVAI
ncbi:MAG: nucleotide exchange factor GrpE [Beijerinckiaceae bacterium]